MSKKNTAPLISVIMSVHNGHQFLRKAIESVLSQTLIDFEFIVVNDASTDNSLSILQSYSDHRLKIINLPVSLGLTKALNTALHEASGEFVARMDADDVCRPDRFRLQVSYLRSHSAATCVGSGVELISEDGVLLGPRWQPQGHAEIRTQLLFGNGGAMTHPVIMFRRDAALKVGGYDEDFAVAQDLDFLLKISEIGQVENLPEVLLEWRQHPGSVNRNKYDTWRQMKRLAISNAIKRVGADCFANDFFSQEQVFFFPSCNIDLAEYASRNGRFRSALGLLFKEVLSGSFKLKACRQIAFVLVQYAITRSRRLFVSRFRALTQ